MFSSGINYVRIEIIDNRNPPLNRYQFGPFLTEDNVGKVIYVKKNLRKSRVYGKFSHVSEHVARRSETYCYHILPINDCHCFLFKNTSAICCRPFP